MTTVDSKKRGLKWCNQVFCTIGIIAEKLSANDARNQKAERLNKLKAEIDSDTSLPLSDEGGLVFGRGDPSAEIVLIEAPGEQEQKQGKPFVGPAGVVLNKLLTKLNLTMDDIYICNVLKYRPPGNRDPHVKEVTTHTPYLLKQLHIISPKLIIPVVRYVLAGFDASKMKEMEGITKVHGKKYTITSPNGDIFQVIPAFHPAAVLHNKLLDPDLNSDFEKIGEYINSTEHKNPKPQPTVPTPVKKQRTLDSFFGKK